ncbi:MAG TPA: YbjQ family protein [Oculatellaceae cyanobacterium]
MRNTKNAYRMVGLIAVSLLLSFSSNPSFASQNDTSGSFAAQTTNPLMVSTTESFEGFRIKQYCGIVRGVTVRQPTIGQGLKANLKGIVGGKISPFISMCETARQQSLDILIARAQQMGANAVVGLRYDSSSFGETDDMGSEVVCYGTAVVIEPSATKTAIVPTELTEPSETKTAHAIVPVR